MNESGFAQLDRLEHAAQRLSTPFSGGSLVWRRWGAGNPVILFHGGSGSWKHWVRNIDALARHHEVWAPDLPGFGDSDLPEAPQFPVIARAVADGFGQLRPGTKACIAGFSFGSVLAGYLACGHPALVARTVVINGHLIGRFEAQPRRMLTRWRDIADPAEFDKVMRHNLSLLMLSNSAAIDDLAVAIYGADLRKSRLRAIDVMASRDDDILVKAPTPLVTISGGRDPVAVPNVADQVRRLKQARPDVTCHVLEGVGHWAMYEAAGAVNELLLESFRDGSA